MPFTRFYKPASGPPLERLTVFLVRVGEFIRSEEIEGINESQGLVSDS